MQPLLGTVGAVGSEEQPAEQAGYAFLGTLVRYLS